MEQGGRAVIVTRHYTTETKQEAQPGQEATHWASQSLLPTYVTWLLHVT